MSWPTGGLRGFINSGPISTGSQSDGSSLHWTIRIEIDMSLRGHFVGGSGQMKINSSLHMRIYCIQNSNKIFQPEGGM